MKFEQLITQTSTMRDHFRVWYLLLTFSAAGSGLTVGLLTLPWQTADSVLAIGVGLLLFVVVGIWATFNHHGVYRSATMLKLPIWLFVQLLGSAAAAGFLTTQVMFAGVTLSPGLLLFGLLAVLLYLLIVMLNRVFAALERPQDRIVS